MLYLYENFLLDLKVNLLGVDATLSLVDCIDNAINQLHAHEHQEDVFISNIGIEDETVNTEKASGDSTPSDDSVFSSDEESSEVNCSKDLPWTENEEELLLLCYEKGKKHRGYC